MFFQIPSKKTRLLRHFFVPGLLYGQYHFWYCIPQADVWTIVLNSNIDSWGLVPDTTKDLFRFAIPVKQNHQHLEYFTMIFEKADEGAELFIAWGDVEARLPINF